MASRNTSGKTAPKMCTYRMGSFARSARAWDKRVLAINLIDLAQAIYVSPIRVGQPGRIGNFEKFICH